jgi:hypothetical protein
MDIEAVSSGTRTAILARIAYELTICARNTYEVGTENVLEPQLLRAYNELEHRVTAAVVSNLKKGAEGQSLESILEMMRAFGTRHNRAVTIESAINRAMQSGE